MSPSCPDRERLLDAFKLANRDLIDLHEEETTAAIKHDFAAFDPLGRRLKESRKRRDEAAEELKRHIREHGCS